MSNTRSRSNNKRRGQGNFNNYVNRNKIGEFLTEKLNESEVGITLYTGPDVSGFSGIIKARYSDFHVNEINTSNEIAKLTDLTVPQDFYESTNNSDENQSESFEKLLKEDIVKQLQDLIASEDDRQIEIDADKLSKEERCKIYDVIRANFGNKILANTKTVDDKKVMTFRKFKKNTDTVDNRARWPANKGEYVYFLVYKEALDTLEACFKIADCLKRNSSIFTYAGVKDRRAKTTQWFCTYKLDPAKLFHKTKPMNKLHVGNITFHTEPLKLGQLNGNHFKVALRNVTAEDSLIKDAMDSIQNNGFINYYGLQRFGNDKEVPTYEVGVQLLLGKFKEACNLILKVKTNEDPSFETAQAKRVYNETKDCQLACKQFRRLSNKCVESKLLIGFVKNNPNDYVNALENIPRNMRLLYIHAFQSLVWNKMASLRIEKFGLKPVEGDMVCLKQDCDETEGESIKILTSDDVNDYTIYDIVLPLPGYDVKYPENELKNSYDELLRSYGLTLEMPKQSVKTYTLSGTYRKIVGKVTNFTYRTIRYNHPDDTLIRSDYEELMGHKEPEDKPNGQYKALIIEFSLQSSGYATMVLREILKMDTSSSIHAKLNKYAPETSSVKESEVAFAASDSLLSNAEKYEEFKRKVFGSETNNKTEESSKHKLDDADDENNKKVKNDLAET